MQNKSHEQTYTVSKLQMYDDCPQKYKLCYIDKVHIVESLRVQQASERGNKLHNLINYYLKKQDITKLIPSLTTHERELWINFKNGEFQYYQTVASEYAFNVKVDEHWLTGRIDALCKYDDQYIILDWKTSENFMGENVNFQTAFYLLCMYEILYSVNYIKSPEQLSLHYVNLAAGNTVKINFDGDKLLMFKTQVLDVINKINTDNKFCCNKSDKCKKCKYLRACAYY